MATSGGGDRRESAVNAVRLPRRAEVLVIPVATGSTLAEAAREARLPLRSAQRYAALPAFRARVEEVQRENTQVAIDRYRSLGIRAAMLLAKAMLIAESIPANARNLPVILKTARELREAVTASVEMSDVLRRLDALERKHRSAR